MSVHASITINWCMADGTWTSWSNKNKGDDQHSWSNHSKTQNFLNKCAGDKLLSIKTSEFLELSILFVYKLDKKELTSKFQNQVKFYKRFFIKKQFPILSQVDYWNRMMQRLNENYPNCWLVFIFNFQRRKLIINLPQQFFKVC